MAEGRRQSFPGVALLINCQRAPLVDEILLLILLRRVHAHHHGATKAAMLKAGTL